jgi:transcriptional regulator with XRE-family HTH domain
MQAGELVVRLRKARGWSRRELARRADLSETTVRNLEAGGRTDNLEYGPSEKTLRQVADAFGGTDGGDFLRAYGRDDMARFVEASAGLRIVRGRDELPVLSPDQEQALERIMAELKRLLATANLTSHKGAYVRSDRERVESRPAA